MQTVTPAENDLGGITELRDRSVIIVGASVAGTRAATALRQRGHTGSITLLSEEEHWPYDKPPLSKALLVAGIDPVVPYLLTEADARDLDLAVLRGTRAAALDPITRTVTTEIGKTLQADIVIIATGVSPRLLPVPSGMAGVYTLRTLDDATNLRRELDSVRHVVVIGGGFIGAEFASAAAARGLLVTIVEAQDVPLSHLFGTDVGAELSTIHELNGVSLVSGVPFGHFVGADRVTGVVLADGRELPAELVVVGIGAAPATQWLEGSGLPIPNGVETGADFQVTGFPGVYAIGDIALRHFPLLDATTRVEHWTNAGEHAEALAAALTATDQPQALPPYVWSDQYGSRFQILGRPSLGTVAVSSGSIAAGQFTAVYTTPSGHIVGAVAFNDSKAIGRFRKAMRHGTPFMELEAATAGRSRASSHSNSA